VSEAPKKSEKRPPWWLVVIGTLPAVVAIGILAFVARLGIASDESRCPFHEVETREVAPGISIREESRRCIEEIEEHRWLSVREGESPLELGRFPLEAAQIDDGFPWSARIDEGRAVVTVTNVDRGDLVFREPDADQPR
jgi:hypothetical protein